jgi:putative tricarboxylic transport membrane protein
MTDFLSAISQVLTLETIFWTALGEILGILIGALPGLTATMGIALLLPVSFQLSFSAGFGMLLGVYCGAVSGASIPAILLGIPGNPNALATMYDGTLMTGKGQAGLALGSAVTASFIGGMLSLAALVLFAPLVARFTLLFGPAEKATLALVGLTIIASVSSENIAKGLVTGALGLFLSSLGVDAFTNTIRLPFPARFAHTPLVTGLGLIPILIGLYGVSQVFTDLGRLKTAYVPPVIQQIGSVFPSWKKIRSMWRIILESTGIGTLIGAIPGTGASIAVFLAYDRAKKITAPGKHGLDRVGTGCVEGVFAPEVANNAVTGGALIPTLALGIPGDSSTAILLGALLIKGVVPGYQLFQQRMDLVYAVFLTLLLANVFMFIFQIWGIRWFAQVTKVKLPYLLPFVLILSLIGSYAVSGQAVTTAVYDMTICLVFGVLGFALKKADYPIPPLVLGVILGGMLEENFRRAVKLAGGDYTVFFTKPISLLFILLAVVSVLLPLLKKKGR